VVVTGKDQDLPQQFVPTEDKKTLFTASSTSRVNPVISLLFGTSEASTFPKLSEMVNALALLPDLVSLMTIALDILWYDI
jgi:hypothetical protein